MKILIIRLSSIGDIILTSPVIRCLKKQLLGCEIHYATKKQFHDILSSNPNIDKILLFDNNLWQFIQIIKNEKYDYIVDLHNNQRTAAIKMFSGVRSHSFHKLNFRKWLLVNLKVNIMPNIHIVDRYMNTLKPLGVSNDGNGLDYFLPDSANILPSDIEVFHHKDFVAFSIGGQHQTKRLPTEKMVSICKQIKHPVILLGGKNEGQEGDFIVTSSGDHVVNACGRINLHASADLIRRSKVVISHDTGLMHIAAAFSKPMVSVWGNTVPAFGMAPYYPYQSNTPSLIAQVQNLPCRPCSKIGYKKCPKGHFKCMNMMNENAIIDFINLQFLSLPH